MTLKNVQIKDEKFFMKLNIGKSFLSLNLK